MALYKLDGSNVELILTYEDVFNDALPDIKAEIKTLNMHKSISIVCELIGARLSKSEKFYIMGVECVFPYETVIKKEILGISPKSPEEFSSNPILHKNKHIITIQMLLMLLKFILAYGNRETLSKTDYSITKDDYKKIIQLQLAVSNEYNKITSSPKFDKNHFIYANYHLNYERNVACEFTRMYYIFEMLCKNKSLFDDVKKEFRDYYNDFCKKYSISPTQYLFYLFAELTTYLNENRTLSYQSVWRNIDENYINIKDKSIIHKIIDELSFNIDSSNIEWANNTIDKFWDFSRFFSKPFIQINDLYISISDVTLRNAFFEKMFWLVRECYPKDDSRAMSFFGRLFERYIQTITEKAISSSYEYISEFQIGGKENTKKSSDAYIKSGENLLVIEAKGFSVLQNCMIRNTSVEENNKKLFVKPILQADTFLSETISEFDSFKNIKDAYIVSVTIDSINAVPDYYTSIIDEIEKNKKCVQSKYFFNLNIEEYEMLLCVIEAGEDCFSLLKDYYCQEALSPFSTFLLERYPQITTKMTSYMKEIYNKASTEMMNTLFGK